MSGPITPDEAAMGAGFVPGIVFDVVNGLLSTGLRTIRQEEIVRRLVARGMKRSEAFENGCLDFEDAYRSVGWVVEYDKPGFNETYEPFWTFRRGSK